MRPLPVLPGAPLPEPPRADPAEAAVLSYAEARLSPCATCATAPCCAYLPLQQFQVQTLRDLDQAIYLLNFDNIELGLSHTGQWGAYYRQPCRFLDQERALCTIHDRPEQPRICANYNPYTCWYRRALGDGGEATFLRIDRRRMEVITELVAFDEARQLVSVPSWDELREQLTPIPVEAPLLPGGPPPPEDPVFLGWQERLRHRAPEPPPRALPYDESYDPCQGCSAPCCTTLLFPHGLPATRANLDYYRFCLGFPGVELGISDREWHVVVRTRCRHFTGGRCGVYGKPERPLLCRYYDATSCTYRVQFGRPRPPGFLRVRLEQFRWLAECFTFDEDGAILEVPPVGDLRGHVERRWQEALYSQPGSVLAD